MHHGKGVPPSRHMHPAQGSQHLPARSAACGGWASTTASTVLPRQHGLGAACTRTWELVSGEVPGGQFSESVISTSVSLHVSWLSTSVKFSVTPKPELLGAIWKE